MDARLPQNPNLGFYRKLAKELKRSLAKGEAAALARLVAQHPKFIGQSASGLLGQHVSIADAQLVIAREHGFERWAAFKAAVLKAALEPEPAPTERLLAAVRAGDAEQVRALCAASPGLAAMPDSKGTLPLVEAAERGLRAIAEVLLDAGADATAGDPLLFAAHPGPHKAAPALDVVELLIARGAPNDVFTHALLGRVGALQRALAAADVNARGPANSTALFLAAWNGQLEAVRVLLALGADPNPVCRAGQSAWQMVFLHKWSAVHREIARLLLEHGVPCSFHEACILSHLPTVARLLAAKPALKDEPSAAGVTPLAIALVNADVGLAKLLLDAGAADAKGQARALVTARPQQGANLSGSLYRNCSFAIANFHDCSLADATFSDINLSGARFDNVNLAGVRIDNAFIRGLTIYGIEVEPLLVKELERRAGRKQAAG